MGETENGQLELPNLPQVSAELMAVLATYLHNGAAVCETLSGDWEDANQPERAQAYHEVAKLLRTMWERTAELYKLESEAGAVVDAQAATQMVLTLGAQLPIVEGIKELLGKRLEG